MQENANEKKYSSERFLEFNVGSEYYAIELLSVIEVLSIPETTPIPNSPEYVLGIMNLRGEIITITDLRKRLKISPQEDQSEASVIISKVNGVKVGIVVDSINRVFEATEETLSEVIDSTMNRNSKYIRCIHKEKSHLVFLLDLSLLLDLQDLKVA